MSSVHHRKNVLSLFHSLALSSIDANFFELKEVLTWENSSFPTWLDLDTNMAAVLFVLGHQYCGRDVKSEPSIVRDLYRNCNTILTFCRSTVPSSPASLKRYYFEHLQLNSTQLKFSVSSASRLPEDLQSLKSSLGLILVNLEDASIDLGTSQTKTFT